MKVLFIVSDGVGLRNYLYSDILKVLIRQGHQIIVWHALNDEIISSVENLHQVQLQSDKLPKYKESIFEKFFREAICLARLRYNVKLTNNSSLWCNWSPKATTIKHKLFNLGIYSFASCIRSYRLILLLEQWHQHAIAKSKYLTVFNQFLQAHNPDVVFNTHQRAISAIPAIYAANQLSIKTVCAIFSWDNLPKARLNTRTDLYFVWSGYMQQEMHNYYPEICKDRIMVTGTPQFDFYADKKLYWSKQQFCTKFNLDQNRPIVCFSGDDVLTSPFDPDYLQDLAEAVAGMDAIVAPQILFRRCPVDFSGRYDDVLQAYQAYIKISEPLWYQHQKDGQWASVYPDFNDVQLLINIAMHCDVVYNLGSTMAHDFAMFNKPAIYINYDQPGDHKWSVNSIYKFQHFRSMNGFDAVDWVHSKEEIATTLTAVIQAPMKASPDRKKWLQRVTGLQSNAAKKVAEFLVDI